MHKQIVLKFKRPGIDAVVKEDMNTLRQGLNVLQKIPGSNAEFTLLWLDEFERGLQAELDFRKEIKNISFIDMCNLDCLWQVGYTGTVNINIDIPKGNPYNRYSNKIICREYPIEQ